LMFLVLPFGVFLTLNDLSSMLFLVVTNRIE
jgi:hypothetical protein